MLYAPSTDLSPPPPKRPPPGAGSIREPFPSGVSGGFAGDDVLPRRGPLGEPEWSISCPFTSFLATAQFPFISCLLLGRVPLPFFSPPPPPFFLLVPFSSPACRAAPFHVIGKISPRFSVFLCFSRPVPSSPPFLGGSPFPHCRQTPPIGRHFIVPPLSASPHTMALDDCSHSPPSREVSGVLGEMGESLLPSLPGRIGGGLSALSGLMHAFYRLASAQPALF